MKIMLRKIRLALGALILSCMVPLQAWAINLDTELSSWMSYVSDSTKVSDLTIPGTHDSGARHEPWPGLAKTQTLSIREQLNIGVRYLDIRLRHYEDALVVHHGSVYQHLNFIDVLNQVTDFLADNPSETVLMQVSEEYEAYKNTQTFEATFNTYANNSSFSSYWWRHSYVPTLGDVRGKIVLLRRFRGSFWSSGGINIRGWQDNAAFTLYDTRNTAINVQDYYKVKYSTNNNKWGEIRSMLSSAESDSASSLYLNFTSGYRSFWGIPDIPGVAKDINKRLIEHFKGIYYGDVKHGVIISDFITKEMTKAELTPFFR